MIIYPEHEPQSLDALVVGAHPDDIEIYMGGTIAALVASGRKVGVVDLTRGEMGSRGEPGQRREESIAAAQVLNLALRANLGLTDGDLANTREGRSELIRLIRRFRPRMVFTHYPKDPHPDHTAAFLLTRAATHNAGLAKIDVEGEPYRPSYLFSFFQAHRAEPSFLVDISEYWETKKAAIACHQSQVSLRREGEPDTYLSRSFFFDVLQAHARSFGAMVGVVYAEPFYSYSLLVVADPLEAFHPKKGRLL